VAWWWDVMWCCGVVWSCMWKRIMMIVHERSDVLYIQEHEAMGLNGMNACLRGQWLNGFKLADVRCGIMRNVMVFMTEWYLSEWHVPSEATTWLCQLNWGATIRIRSTFTTMILWKQPLPRSIKEHILYPIPSIRPFTFHFRNEHFKVWNEGTMKWDASALNCIWKVSKVTDWYVSFRIYRDANDRIGIKFHTANS